MDSGTIQDHYNAAFKAAISLVESRARAILRSRPKLREFVMAMGAYTFYDADGPIHDPDSWADPVYDLIAEWDEYLKLSGTPMRFTTDGPVIRDW